MSTLLTVFKILSASNWLFLLLINLLVPYKSRGRDVVDGKLNDSLTLEERDTLAQYHKKFTLHEIGFIVSERSIDRFNVLDMNEVFLKAKISSYFHDSFSRILFITITIGLLINCFLIATSSTSDFPKEQLNSQVSGMIFTIFYAIFCILISVPRRNSADGLIIKLARLKLVTAEFPDKLFKPRPRIFWFKKGQYIDEFESPIMLGVVFGAVPQLFSLVLMKVLING